MQYLITEQEYKKLRQQPPERTDDRPFNYEVAAHKARSIGIAAQSTPETISSRDLCAMEHKHEWQIKPRVVQALREIFHLLENPYAANYDYQRDKLDLGERE